MPRPVGDKARAVTSSSPSEDNERTVLPGRAKDELPTHHLSPHSSYPAEYAGPLPPTSQLLQPPLRRQRGSQSQSQGQPGRGTSWPPKTSATTTVVAVSPTKRSSMVTPSLSPTQRRPASSTFSSLALQVGQKPTTVPSTPQVRMVSTTAAPRIRTTCRYQAVRHFTANASAFAISKASHFHIVGGFASFVEPPLLSAGRAKRGGKSPAH